MGNCSRVTVVTVIAVILFFGLGGTIIAFAYREANRVVEKVEDLLSEVTVLKFFPGLFLDEDNQALRFEELQLSFLNRTAVTETYTSNNRCSFSCPSISVGRKKRQAHNITVTHGCCRSTLKYDSPDTKDNKKILQYHGLRQYFPVYECEKDTSCTGCTCSKEKLYFTAVTIKEGVSQPQKVSDTRVDGFIIDGCCKCVTN